MSNYNIEMNNDNIIILSYDPEKFNEVDLIEFYNEIQQQLLDINKFVIIINADRPAEFKFESIKDFFDNDKDYNDFNIIVHLIKSRIVKDIGVYNYDVMKARFNSINQEIDFPWKVDEVNELSEKEVIIFNDLEYAIEYAKAIL